MYEDRGHEYLPNSILTVQEVRESQDLYADVLSPLYTPEFLPDQDVNDERPKEK